tara:strand:+ start:1136 stop:1468 length:333 start_codon:yes stop_codon:yes gene_type:complete
MLLDIVIKSLVGGLVIGIVSTIAQKNPTVGAFIMGIPLVSFITLIIMYYTGVDYNTFKTFSLQTVYFVAISLIFFPMFAYGYYYTNFWIALSTSAIITAIIMYYSVKLID